MAFKSRISAITDHTEPSRSALSSRASNTTNVANIKTPVSRLNKSDFARSRSWAPPVSITPESKALESIKERQWKRQPKDQCGPTTKPLLIVDVHDFEIYHAPTTDKRAYELISLHYLEVPVSKKLCFDGFIRVGTVNHYIQAVGIQDCSIEGYGDEENPGIIAYIRSFASSKDQSLEIWYRLRNATPNYQRFHEPFLWVAQLGKHVLDYIEEQPVHSVTLLSFRKAFHSWLTGRFPNNNEFKQWHTAFRQQKDFRIALHAYIEYFYHQAFNLSTSKQLLNQPLWAECMAKGLTFVKPQQEILDYTLATPDVYACFKHMYFGEQIRERCPVRSVQLEQERRKRKLGIAQTPHALGSRNHLHSLNRCQPYGASLVRVGDVVVFTPEKNDGMIWKNTSWDWLAYVQDTQLLDDGTQRLYVLWIYQSCETNIYKAEYPFKNEVFLSDNCNCTEGELLSTDIKGKYNLDWCPPSIEKDRLFIRQTYITQDSAFVSLRDEHKTCVCRKKDVFLHCPGDTVYMGSTLNEEEPLEPVLIHNIHQATGLVTVRRMSRLKRDCAEIATRAHRVDIAPNELVFTDQYETLAMSRIQRRCSVKILTKSDIESNQVPFPYNLGGAGDFWFMAMGLVEANGKQHLVYLQNLPKSFKQGPDVLERSEGTLRGLSIFSGGGSLDRGLEEGGAVKIHTAVDFSAEACHTQRANAQDPENLHIYCGSVDDYLDTVLRGKDQKFIPRVGEVDLIVAGSPCPGFSTLQQDWQSSQSLRNASHISTFCSFIDVYRPLYGILENVVNMSSTRKGYEDQNVLSQVVASLVSMGYQNPPGCGYKEAERLGLIPEALKKSTRSDGRPYARIKEAALVPTITTTSNMRDNYNGASVHWDQDRSISILEARRAQGYPDDEPIIGKLKEQYKIVGNGVDRKVAFAMGLSLSQAIEKNASDFAANGMTPSASEMYSLADDTEDEKNVTSALSQEHRYSGSVAKRDSEYLELDVDRPSETSPRTSTLSQTDTVQEAPGLRKRLSQHFTNSIGRLSLQSPSKNQTLSILTKRRREPDTGDEEIVTVETSSPSERPGKRAKPSRKSQSSAVTAGESHRKDSMSSSGRSASSSAQ
ncbi:DNA methyltransferase Dim-2 [Pyrenophora tritici-repentis Pt-1C-BFP]|uniref:DNA (cytosine-5-)-methyltransferase n=1 Tax=Pyrenophora tritici-repentis (strain Pt-1C-BFP) TaxID=426418 RepID=B2VVG5_PYRTR|nr:DNA methyltransferase Dim-2 [Pyrenophora tritici-repentis Pt-1C-BFP]EDU41718.1 DNA methyltransferase Dim-2 [Pyrenophora tritici-repentis Pt-1C-BFP]